MVLPLFFLQPKKSWTFTLLLATIFLPAIIFRIALKA